MVEKGPFAMSGGADKSLRLWDLAEDQHAQNRQPYEHDNGWPLEAVANEKLLRRFEGHTDAVYSMAVSPDGRTVLSGGRDACLRLWELK